MKTAMVFCYESSVSTEEVILAKNEIISYLGRRNVEETEESANVLMIKDSVSEELAEELLKILPSTMTALFLKVSEEVNSAQNVFYLETEKDNTKKKWSIGDGHIRRTLSDAELLEMVKIAMIRNHDLNFLAISAI